MSDRISCVEVLTTPVTRNRNGQTTHECYVRHDFWKATARLIVADLYWSLIRSGAKHLLVFDRDLHWGNIPHIPDPPKHDFLAHLISASEYPKAPD